MFVCGNGAVGTAGLVNAKLERAPPWRIKIPAAKTRIMLE